MPIKTHYLANALPHILPIGATFFVTFRLHDSLPKNMLDTFKERRDKRISELKQKQPEGFADLIRIEQKKYFKLFDEALEKVNHGPTWLKQPAIATEIIKQIEKYDGKWYDLLAYCVMSNHVHIIIDTRTQLATSPVEYEISLANYIQVDKIMKRIKGASARYSNLTLNRTGQPFWQRDYFDYFPRNQKELGRIINYVLNNPVKAGIVENWQDYPFTYLKPTDG